MSEIVDGALAEVRLSASTPRRERVSLLDFIDEVAVAAHLHAEYRDIRLTVEVVDPALAIDVDRQLLTSALMNLVQNALKFTRTRGGVTVRTHAANGRVLIDVEDECGGMPEGDLPLGRPFVERSASDRAGLGLGLSISRKAVVANGGEIRHRNIPGTGCVFTIDLPRAPAS